MKTGTVARLAVLVTVLSVVGSAVAQNMEFGKKTVQSLAVAGNAAIGGNSAVAGNATVAGTLTVTGASTFGTLNATDAVLGAGTISGTEIVDATITAADIAATVKQQVAGTLTAVATPNANGGTNVVVVTAKDIGGTTLAVNNQAVAFRCWIGDTAFSAPAAVAGDFAVSNGTEVQQILDKAHYIVMTGTNGVATLTITDDPGRTNALHIATGGGIVTTTDLVWDVP